MSIVSVHDLSNLDGYYIKYIQLSKCRLMAQDLMMKGVIKFYNITTLKNTDE